MVALVPPDHAELHGVVAGRMLLEVACAAVAIEGVEGPVGDGPHDCGEVAETGFDDGGLGHDVGQGRLVHSNVHVNLLHDIWLQPVDVDVVQVERGDVVAELHGGLREGVVVLVDLALEVAQALELVAGIAQPVGCRDPFQDELEELIGVQWQREVGVCGGISFKTTISKLEEGGQVAEEAWGRHEGLSAI